MRELKLTIAAYFQYRYVLDAILAGNSITFQNKLA